MDYTLLATLRSSADAEVAAELIGEFGEVDQGNTKGALTGYRNDVNTYDSQAYPATGWHWIVSWMRDGDGRAPQGATGIRYSDYIYADPAHPYFSYQPPWKPGHPKTGSWPAYYHLSGLYDDGKIESYPDTNWWPGQNCLCERYRATRARPSRRRRRRRRHRRRLGRLGSTRRPLPSSPARRGRWRRRRAPPQHRPLRRDRVVLLLQGQEGGGGRRSHRRPGLAGGARQSTCRVSAEKLFREVV